MNEKVIFLTSHCPKCKVIEMKLKQKGIEYEECDNVDIMISKGMKSAPGLEVDGKILDFAEAAKWIREQ